MNAHRRRRYLSCRSRQIPLRPSSAVVALVVSACFLASPLFAQQVGPLPIPPSVVKAENHPAPAKSAHPAAPQEKAYPIIHEPPAVPVEKIIQQFAAHEGEFKLERDNFTYMQTFVIQTIGDSGQPDGEYRMTSDITFTPDGQRYEKITDAPVPTLTRIDISEQDLDDLRDIQPFVLTTKELPQYNITYVGRQHVDQLDTYVFDVAPKKIEKNHRYFQGRIWVEATELEIVKTDGKAVPDIIKGDHQNLFPEFVTYRQNIEGHYWFPVYTHADTVLHFRMQNVHIRMTVRWYDYKRFRVSYKILSSAPHN